MAAVVANLCRYAPVICWNIDDLFSTGSQYVEPTGFFSMKLFADYNFRPLWIRVWKKQGGAGPRRLHSPKQHQAPAAI